MTPNTDTVQTPTPSPFTLWSGADRTSRDQALVAMATAMQQTQAGQGDLTDETLIETTTSYEFPGVSRHAYLLPDFVLSTDSLVRCVEANGSNGAGSSVHGRDVPRVRHEIETMLARGIKITRQSVVITPESPDTRSLPEIRTRAALRAVLLAEEYDVPVRVARAGHGPLPSDAAVALWGPIPEIADHLALGPYGLTYAGRPVAFLNNVNLLVELARRHATTIEQVLAATTTGGRPDIVHEGSNMALLSLDKVKQQQVLASVPSVQPVTVGVLTRNFDELVSSALIVAALYGGAIIKPLAASGGTGVIPVDHTASRAQVLLELTAAARKLEKKYGPGWQETCPFGVFEFIDIQPAVTDTGHYRWDLRLQVLATPVRTIVTPLSARLCPQPIGHVLDRANGVNNLTGRATAEANRLGVHELVDLVDAGPDLLERFATAAYEFTRAAVDAR